MICRLLFLFLSITLGFAASSNIDFQDDDELLSNLGTEPNSVVLASESQNGGLDEFGMVATNKPPYAAAAVGTSEAASLIQSNNNDHHDDDDDECADNYGQSPRKMRSKRGSAICDPSTRNSPPSVQGSGHDPSTKDPEDINGGTNKKDSQRIAQPTRDFQESDCAAMPSAPTPVCAVVSEYYVRLHLVYPMSGLLAGWWQLLYARTAPPACYREVGEIFFCCALVFPVSVPSEMTLEEWAFWHTPFADFDKNLNNLRYPILRAQWPLTAVSCIPMEDMKLPSEAP